MRVLVIEDNRDLQANIARFLDQETRQGAVFDIVCDRANTCVLAIGYMAYDPDVTPEGEYGYDPERARELLAEAGYPDGVEFEWLVPSLDDHRAVAEALVPMLAEVGLRASTRVIPITAPLLAT